MFSSTDRPTTLHHILSIHCKPSLELVRDFENAAVLHHVTKGDAIVRQGEVCDCIVFNRVGLFRVSNVTDDIEDTLLFGSSGDVFTSLHSWFAGEPSIFSLVAVIDSEAWTISYNKIRQLSERHPELVTYMRNLLIEQTYGFEKRYLFFNNKSAEERFRNFLQRHHSALRRVDIKFIQSIVPLKYIAQYLKISPSTLSRLRRKLVSSEE